MKPKFLALVQPQFFLGHSAGGSFVMLSVTRGGVEKYYLPEPVVGFTLPEKNWRINVASRVFNPKTPWQSDKSECRALCFWPSKSFAVYCSGQKLVLSRTRLVGLGQALCMTASPEPAVQDVIPIASGRQNGRAHAGLPNWFWGRHRDIEEAFEFFRHPAAGGSSAQRGEVLTWTSSARRFLSPERGLLQQGNTFSVQGKSSAQTGGRGAVSQSAAGRLVGPELWHIIQVVTHHSRHQIGRLWDCEIVLSWSWVVKVKTE